MKLREASTGDLDITFEWASSEELRRFSFNKNPVKKEEHRDWFMKKINDKDCEFYMLIQNNDAMGYVRFDIYEQDKALISYLVASSYQGRGYGTKMLSMGIETLRKKRPEIRYLQGSVLNENIPSMAIFEKLDFVKSIRDINSFNFEKRI